MKFLQLQALVQQNSSKIKKTLYNSKDASGSLLLCAFRFRALRLKLTKRRNFLYKNSQIEIKKNVENLICGFATADYLCGLLLWLRFILKPQIGVWNRSIFLSLAAPQKIEKLVSKSWKNVSGKFPTFVLLSEYKLATLHNCEPSKFEGSEDLVNFSCLCADKKQNAAAREFFCLWCGMFLFATWHLNFSLDER